jgi:hypothetical protein
MVFGAPGRAEVGRPADVIVGRPSRSTQFRSDRRIYMFCEMMSVPLNDWPSYTNKRRNRLEATDCLVAGP